MFGYMKDHGFDLELTRFHYVQRLSRISLIVCLLHVWLLALGEQVASHGLGNLVDCNDRRDLSIFRLGWDFIERTLTLGDPTPPFVLPLFNLNASGS